MTSSGPVAQISFGASLGQGNVKLPRIYGVTSLLNFCNKKLVWSISSKV